MKLTNVWFHCTVKSEKGRRLGMGRLLADMTTKMQARVQQGEKNPLKILVYSTHDSTLAALCSTFDVFDEKYDVLSAICGDNA
jgi:acid phosphatase